ncbi:protein BUR2, partial [Lecanoromycetidae sp. Uapishka_2]
MPASTASSATTLIASQSQSHPPAALPSEILMIAETQWLFTESELNRTPSILDGLPPKTEREYRSKGVNFILQVGIMLKLPQITLATASIFLHRFFMRHSMQTAPGKGYHHYEVGATSLFLATKVEENCRKMKELVIACVRVAQKDPHKQVDEQDKEYWRWRDVILFNEDVMLEAVCFDLSLEPPHKIFFDLLMMFGEEYAENKRLRNTAWAFVNDSCLTTLCLQYPSKTIAAAALYCAAKFTDVQFPDDERGRPWWDVIDVKLEELIKACNHMADIYENAPPKAGREGGIYERTPEATDEDHDKTRAMASKTLSPEGSGGFRSVSPLSSRASDERPAKRPREDEPDSQQTLVENGTQQSTNGNVTLRGGYDSPRKRQRLSFESAQSDGVSETQRTIDAIVGNAAAMLAQPNGAAVYSEEEADIGGGGLVSPKLDNDVEEGEVEA